MKKIIEHLQAEWYKYVMEILVLIIGIYGAFAVDNWNEDRSRKKFEQNTLERVLVNLKSDQANLIKANQIFKSAISSSEKILAFDAHSDDRDSLKYWLANVVQFERFQPLTNAYEVLKSKGLDLLSDQELAYDIGKYYDDDAQRAVKALEDIEGTFNADWQPILKKDVIVFEFRKKVILSDWDLLIQNGQPRRIIIMNKDNYSFGSMRIALVIENLEKLIVAIENQLNK